MARISHNEIIIASAVKDLQRDWAATAEGWHDSAREEFEEEYIRRLVAAARTAEGAMGEISRLMEQAVRECS
ncbi:MAG TPA: hypothetical protein PK280_13565 [Planctomycetota bacterium]|nr:hypothetical protein [Planctomycetota bacterium]